MKVSPCRIPTMANTDKLKINALWSRRSTWLAKVIGKDDEMFDLVTIHVLPRITFSTPPTAKPVKQQAALAVI